ncbi:uncharacterized protein KQ657_004750 [Scheffersomyces spartinae]|uniref:Uncharacterized protein n=1 Tax=Scheffersomyces spartinae TaxID=45513 RepID=A0A9P8AJ99_9ASCO|nr:uncharacterized protein KQ657_004750 [Scheffersomyces spartinae]KAG7194535.1 hypothetical protein KQ657_004750 [Scheffersomyces spartinae]
MLITASSIKESKEHFDLVKAHPEIFYSTAGVHPCTVAKEFYAPVPLYDTKLATLKDIIEEGATKGYIKAIGEIGLDYDRLHYTPKEQQLEAFERQLQLAALLKHLHLPLFLHMRAACDDFIRILKPFIDRGDIVGGVIHSFTGSLEELTKLLPLGLFFSVNGCSLKTQENLETVKHIPINRLMIETDAPWCEIRKSHAGYHYILRYPNIYYPETAINTMEHNTTETDTDPAKVLTSNKVIAYTKGKLDDNLPFYSVKKEKFNDVVALGSRYEEDTGTSLDHWKYPLVKSRNEPVNVGHVAQVVCGIHGFTTEEEIKSFIDTVYDNSCQAFNVQ